MLREYLKEKKINMHMLSKETSIPYSTINDLANGRVAVQNCRAGILYTLAHYLNISMETLYDICAAKRHVPIQDIEGDVYVYAVNKIFTPIIVQKHRQKYFNLLQ